MRQRVPSENRASPLWRGPAVRDARRLAVASCIVGASSVGWWCRASMPRGRGDFARTASLRCGAVRSPLHGLLVCAREGDRVVTYGECVPGVAGYRRGEPRDRLNGHQAYGSVRCATRSPTSARLMIRLRGACAASSGPSVSGSRGAGLASHLASLNHRRIVRTDGTSHTH